MIMNGEFEILSPRYISSLYSAMFANIDKKIHRMIRAKRKVPKVMRDETKWGFWAVCKQLPPN